MEALASAAVVLRARTGSLRFVEESLEPRIAEMEEAKAVGSLRLDFVFDILVSLGFVGSEVEDWSESDSESIKEDALEDLGDADKWDSSIVFAVSAFESDSESSRLNGVNSSSPASSWAEEGLE